MYSVYHKKNYKSKVKRSFFLKIIFSSAGTRQNGGETAVKIKTATTRINFFSKKIGTELFGLFVVTVATVSADVARVSTFFASVTRGQVVER